MLAVASGLPLAHKIKMRDIDMASSSSPAASTSTSAAASTSSCIPSIGPVSPGLVSGHVQSTPSTSSLQHLPKSIHIDDKIHGAYTITEPVLVDLLLSKPIDRLKRVLQHGISSLVGLTPLPAVTRYEHSVGAMLLVRAAGGSVEAQAAALLHDVAHTSLSHVVDGVFGYVVHEDDKMEYLNTTTIPDILKRHGLIAEDVLEEKNYPLLELDAPAVCADRLDYTLRDSVSFGCLPLDEARKISADLTASRDGRFCFKSVQSAKRIAEACMQADEFAWSNPTHSLMYKYAADTIRLAHSTGYMQKSELWEDEGDEAFWLKMTDSKNAEVRKLASKVTKTTRVQEISESESEECLEECYHKERAKIRTIDPDVLQKDGSVFKLSALSEEYKLARAAYLKRKSGEKWYRIIEK